MFYMRFDMFYMRFDVFICVLICFTCVLMCFMHYDAFYMHLDLSYLTSSCPLAILNLFGFFTIQTSSFLNIKTQPFLTNQDVPLFQKSHVLFQKSRHCLSGYPGTWHQAFSGLERSRRGLFFKKNTSQDFWNTSFLDFVSFH